MANWCKIPDVFVEDPAAPLPDVTEPKTVASYYMGETICQLLLLLGPELTFWQKNNPLKGTHQLFVSNTNISSRGGTPLIASDYAGLIYAATKLEIEVTVDTMFPGHGKDVYI